jgi:hypothetical protein
MNTAAVIVLVLILGIVIGAAAIYALERSRSMRLKERFGPEYDRTVSEKGDRWNAESDLERRAKRVERLHIRPLEPTERARFLEEWRHMQARFIDDPNEAVVDADRLIGNVMSAEGYPVQDFEQRAEDISAEHPRVVENYREAHRIAVRHTQGRANTEDLRQAMIHYRILFEELVGQPEYARTGGRV